MSGIRSLRRGPTLVGSATGASAPIYVDSDDNITKLVPAGSGTTEVQLIDDTTAQTITGVKTMTSPVLSSPTLTTPTLTTPTYTGRIDSDNTKVLAAALAITSNGTLATLTGFSWTVVAGATYLFEVNIPTTMTTNGGLSFAFKLTTATLTSIQYQTYAATASDNTTAVSTSGTTTTDQTKMFDSKTAAYTGVNLCGTFVVGTGGTFAFQAAQNTSHIDTTTLAIGTYARVIRVL